MNKKNKKSELNEKNEKKERKINLRITRYNPETDFFPNVHSFFVTARKNDSVLDLLKKIKAEQDGSLTFRSNCERGKCLSCRMNVNGKTVLACKEKAEKNSNEHRAIFVSPAGKNILRDLIAGDSNNS